jgi:AcrR family transcriptional regulator
MGKATTQNTLKSRIIDESIKILGTRGIDGLSLREVAKKLKVTHQAPYHYFPDKSSLLIELKKTGFKHLNEFMQKALDEKIEPFKVLEKIGLTYFDFCLENPGYYRAMFAAPSSGVGVRVPEARQSFECLKKSVENLKSSGGIGPEHSTEIIAMICWTYMHGLVALALDKYPMVDGVIQPRYLAKKMIAQMSLLLGKPT